MGIGPLGAALTGGISQMYQGRQQQRGRELLKGIDKERWGKTFLRKPSKKYLEEAEDGQMTSGDILRNAFTSGLTSYTMGKLFQGDWEGAKTAEGATKPFSKGMFGKAAETRRLAPKYKEAVKAQEAVAGMHGDVMAAGGEMIDPRTHMKAVTSPGTESLQTGLQQIPRTSLPQVPAGISEKALLADSPGFASIFETIKGLGTEGLAGGTEELRRAIMLQMLLQIILGE